MKRSNEFLNGYRHAAKASVEWLHQRAVKMNDPNALHILHSAAFNLGGDFAKADEGLLTSDLHKLPKSPPTPQAEDERK